MSRLLMQPPGYKSVMFWMTILIVCLITIGLMLDPGPN
jgi:hypothetical protein